MFRRQLSGRRIRGVGFNKGSDGIESFGFGLRIHACWIYEI